MGALLASLALQAASPAPLESALLPLKQQLDAVHQAVAHSEHAMAEGLILALLESRIDRYLPFSHYANLALDLANAKLACEKPSEAIALLLALPLERRGFYLRARRSILLGYAYAALGREDEALKELWQLDKEFNHREWSQQDRLFYLRLALRWREEREQRALQP